ncbi:MAG: TetR/AcrR family transcriptional regulator [Lachnospiraceae bacterium]|nr:TetR/AcrR family transcriptional regulator [Lachnospiraceae bacterium]
MARKSRINTKLQIKKVALHLFLEKGFTNVAVSEISKEIGISKGNFTFHYATKEHLLTELIKDLCEFQWLVMERELEEENNPLLAYLFELTTMAGSCYNNSVAKDLYISAYTHPMSLRMIRENDTEKAQKIFNEYCPDWKEKDFALAENIVSGIEYAMFLAVHEEDITLDEKISATLDAIMKIYNVPKDIREESLKKILAMDYCKIGQRILGEFRDYVEQLNEKELEEAVLQNSRK